MYEYYVKVVSEEHMLYLKEIAELYGFYSTGKGTPHSRLVTEILRQYQLLMNQKYPEIYWGNFFRVYPKEQYEPAMKWFVGIIKRTHATQHTFSNDKTYNFHYQEPSS